MAARSGVQFLHVMDPMSAPRRCAACARRGGRAGRDWGFTGTGLHPVRFDPGRAPVCDGCRSGPASGAASSTNIVGTLGCGVPVHPLLFVIYSATAMSCRSCQWLGLDSVRGAAPSARASWFPPHRGLLYLALNWVPGFLRLRWRLSDGRAVPWRTAGAAEGASSGTTVI